MHEITWKSLICPGSTQLLNATRSDLRVYPERIVEKYGKAICSRQSFPEVAHQCRRRRPGEAMSSSSEQTAQRRLAAVLAADVVGYSDLMSKDEEGTLARLRELRRQIIEPRIRAHHGRLVKTIGDGFLCEFSSPVEAVRCAVALQEAVSQASGGERAKPLQLRIGINLGDIIIEEDGDIFGDGVNIASRLQKMALPGGHLSVGKSPRGGEGQALLRVRGSGGISVQEHRQAHQGLLPPGRAESIGAVG
ncbi:adenylate/guanylate cyclase domain-containing protein [Microvirga sp. VF16]|nr:adenylate/guanylate cyclase domain-containing protein [Microvirga sp. VF16]